MFSIRSVLVFLLAFTFSLVSAAPLVSRAIAVSFTVCKDYTQDFTSGCLTYRLEDRSVGQCSGFNGFKDNTISAARIIESGFACTLFEHPNCQGSSVVVSSGEGIKELGSHKFNDKASSFQCNRV